MTAAAVKRWWPDVPCATSSAHAREGTFGEERMAMHMAASTKQWTLAELHSLPDDGNKYELIDGELYVTPPPNPEHETILARLSRILEPYVARHGLGLVYHPRSVVRVGDSEVEPDLMVRRPAFRERARCEDMPPPSLVVETFSPYTRRRDVGAKYDFYARNGIAEYWMIDPERRTITVARRGTEDLIVRDAFAWHPVGASEPLTIECEQLFG
jgi:Uma2 family endonuclease